MKGLCLKNGEKGSFLKKKPRGITLLSVVE